MQPDMVQALEEFICDVESWKIDVIVVDPEIRYNGEALR